MNKKKTHQIVNKGNLNPIEQENDLKGSVLVKTSQKCRLNKVLIKNGQSNQIDMAKYDCSFKENILKITIYMLTFKLF
jgi:hypothetical protein